MIEILYQNQTEETQSKIGTENLNFKKILYFCDQLDISLVILK